MTTVKMVKLGTLIKPAKLQKCGNDDYPVLSMTMHNGLVFQSDKFKKSVASQDKSTYKVVHRNQLVIGFPIDEGVLATQRITDAGIVSPAYGIWDVDQTKIIPEFLEYALRCNRAIDYYKAKLRGSTARRRSLPTPTLLELDVPLPDIEQQKLALTTIHHAKNALDSRQAQLTKLDELINARFVELFNGQGYPVLKWNDVFNTTTGKLDSNAAVENGEYPFFTCSKEILRIDKYAFEQKALLLAGNNAAGKYDVKYYNGKFNAYQRTYVLGLKENWSYRLFQYQLEDKLEYLQQQSLGGLTKYLTLKILGSLEFIIPPKDRQDEFDALVGRVDQQKQAVQQGLDKLELLKNALMQEYFG